MSLILVALSAATLAASCATPIATHRTFSADEAAHGDWAHYWGNPHGTHYSALDQIDTTNVSRLTIAWTYDTGDVREDVVEQTDMQVNPLTIGGALYLVSPKGKLICLDPATGAERWVYDPAAGRDVRTRQRQRGLSYWTDGTHKRLFFSFRQQLIAVDAVTGRPVSSFGDDGTVDLRQGLGREAAGLSVSSVSPGVVFRDIIIMGSTGFTPGHVRAYDVRTGAMRWIFHTIPHPGEFGYESWPSDAWQRSMGANAWSGMTLDRERGIVYLPLGSAGMVDKDFYGADRAGDNLFGTSLVALDATTGKRLWHFQMVKHDLWDRDLPAPPTLVTVRRNGKNIPALAQPTKDGMLYVFDRVTGAPLFPMEERAVPQSDVPGELSARTQWVPLAPAPFARQRLTADLLTARTPEAAAEAARAFAALRSRGPFDPPSLQGTILFPGMDGGAEWGGAAYDPETGLVYVNSNEMAWILKLKPRPAQVPGTSGRALYMNNCAACHSEDGRGSPPEFPSLKDATKRLAFMEMVAMIWSGGGRMPAFPHLHLDEVKSLIDYLRTGEVAASATPAEGSPSHRSASAPSGEAYVFDGYTKFLDKEGYPAIKPPWGTLTAIDVNSGLHEWTIPFGTYPELAAKGQELTGSENYGGSVVTAGGLLFIGATVYDNKMHAFDKKTGALLWETTLPAAGLATPATYMAAGRQFVVIAAGGGKNPKGGRSGKLVAFALPR